MTREVQPNPWNPNRMDAEMFSKAIASVHKFGFVDPVTCRRNDGQLEIVDGEHRWRIAKAHSGDCVPDDNIHLPLLSIPVFDLGEVSDEVAQQLTIVLNETRGQPDKEKLTKLVTSLRERIDDERSLREVMPFAPDRFDSLAGIRARFDSATNAIKAKASTKESQVERVWRLPRIIAEALDDAIAKAKADGAVSDAEALRVIAEHFIDCA